MYDVEFPRADSDEAQWGGFCTTDALEQGSGLDLLSEISEMTPLLSPEADRLVLDGAANSYLAQTRLSRNQGTQLVKYDRFGEEQWSRRVAAQQEVQAFGVSVDMFGNSYTHHSQHLGAKTSDLDVVLARYDSSGVERWVRTLSTPAEEVVLGSRVTRQGDLLATGFTFGSLESYVAAHGDCDLEESDGSSLTSKTVNEDNSNKSKDGGGSFTIKLNHLIDNVSSDNTTLASVSVGSDSQSIDVVLGNNAHDNTTVNVNLSGCTPAKTFTLIVTSVNDNFDNHDKKNNEAYFSTAGDNSSSISIPTSSLFTDNDTRDGGIVLDNYSLCLGTNNSDPCGYDNITTPDDNGTAYIADNGSWWYQSSPGYNGRSYFTAMVFDNDGHENRREICWTSAWTSQPPVLRCQGDIANKDDYLLDYTKAEGNAVSSTLYAADKDGPVTFSVSNAYREDNSSHILGAVTLANPTPCILDTARNLYKCDLDWTYQSDPDYNSTDPAYNSKRVKFTITATQGGDSLVSEFLIKLNAVNDAPIADNISATIIEDNLTTHTVYLSSRDVEEGDNASAMKYYKVSEPQYGSVSWNENSNFFTFTPFDNLSSSFTGVTTFNYYAKDSGINEDGKSASQGKLSSANANITLTIVGYNDPPIADNKTDNITQGTPGTITLTATDIDIGDSIATYTITSLPAHGTLTDNATGLPLNAGDNLTSDKVTFTPFDNLSASFSDNTSFTYTATDDSSIPGTSDNATVSLTVLGINDSPVASSGSGASVTEDSPDNLTLSATDIDIGDSLSYTVSTQPSFGNVTITGNQLLFTPFDNLSATDNVSDSLIFQVTDSQGATDTATITLTVLGSNDSPVASPGSGASVTEDSPDNLTLSATDIDIGDSLSYAVSTQPSFGNVTITGNQLLFTPFDNLSATDNVSDSLIFQVTDSQGSTDTATITLTVLGSNDSPVASDNSSAGTITEDSPDNITLIATDIDIGDSLSYTVMSQPTYGTVSISGDQLLFTPNDNLSAGSSFSDSFVFQVTDSQGATDNATITLTVLGSNDSPVASDNSSAGTITEDSPDNITLIATDIDIGDSLSYTVLSQPTYGTVSISGNQLLFTPNDNLSAINYTDSFVFKVVDAQGATDNATVALTVTGVNDTPTANPVSDNVTEDTPGTVTLSASDPDMGDSLTYSLLTNPQYGTVSNFNQTTGTFTFTPNESLAHNLSYTDTFTYQAQDDAPTGSATSTATITLAVTGVNDAPVADASDYTNNPSYYVRFDQTPSLTLTGSDVDGDGFTFHLANPQPQYTQISGFNSLTGSLTLSLKDSLSCSASVKDQLNFYVQDAQGAASNTATVEFRVTGPLSSSYKADLFVAKYDSEGNQLWSRQLGTPMADVGVAVVSDHYGNIYLTGITQGTLEGDSSAGGWDVFLIKFGGLGQELWRRQFGSVGDETVVSITTDEAGNVYLTGQTSGNLAGFVNAGGKDLFVTKYDPQGNKVWMHQWGTTEDEVGMEVSVDALGNLNLLGRITTEAETTQPKHFYSRYEPEVGRLLWLNYLDTSQLAGQALTLDYTGNVFLAGSQASSNLGGSSTSIFEYQPGFTQ